ncbi:Calcium-Responsive Transcription Factor [Manis pentadactyla]|nr:Calcium-Responsive Transcription Factor [Manis pentadactyla]
MLNDAKQSTALPQCRSCQAGLLEAGVTLAFHGIETPLHLYSLSIYSSQPSAFLRLHFLYKAAYGLSQGKAPRITRVNNKAAQQESLCLNTPRPASEPSQSQPSFLQ